MILTVAVLSLALIAALWTVLTSGLMRSVIGLAALSVLVTILMYMLGARLAAVFELSVCGGLITVVFVSTISMTQPDASKSEPHAAKRKPLRRYAILPLLVVASGIAVVFFSADLKLPDLPEAAKASTDAREVLWGQRQTDLLAQAIVILAGALGVTVLFKERKR
jgi:NADH-quinone oxidoreductase subunit J